MCMGMVFAGQGLSNTPNPEDRPAKISLDDAKRYAVTNNFKVKSVSEKVNAAVASKNRTHSSFYPKFGVAGGLDQYSAGETEEKTSVGYVYGSINLFNGFRDSYKSEMSALVEDKFQVELEQEKFRVELDVEEQFHRYLYFKDLITINNDSLALNQKHQKLVRKTKSMGQASETDLMEFDLKESIIRSELVSLEQGLETSRIHLKRLLGEEVGKQIEPVGALQHQHIKGNLMAYLDQIKTTSIPVKLAAKEQAISSLKAKSWRSKWLPSVDFEAQAGNLPLDLKLEGIDSRESSMRLLLVAKLELFSGMDTYWESRETDHLKNSAASELKHEILMSITEMEESYRKLKAIEKRVDLELNNVSKSKEYYESVLKEYQRGYKNSADLSGATDRYFEARARQVEFKFNFLQERLAFERSLGAPLKVEIIQEHKPEKQ